MYRQGDVLLVPIERLPAGGKRVENNPDGGVTLAFGEATGHHHTIRGGDGGVTMFRPDDMPAGGNGNGPFFLVVEGGSVTLEHQEHDEIVIPPGRYMGAIQVEETPQRTAYVAD